MSNPSKFLKPVTLGASIIWLSTYLLRAFPDPQGTDLFPLYSAGAALLNGQNPYSIEFSYWLNRSWLVTQTNQVAPVIAYPLPLLIVIAPIALLPLSLAVYIWVIISVFLIVQIARLSKNPQLGILSLILFYPLFHALIIKTSSVIWVGIAGCSLVLIERMRYPIILGLLLAILPLKPQAGLIFFIYSIIKILKSRNTPALTSAILVSLILWSSSFVLDHQWISKWLDNINLYQKQAVSFTLLPFGIAVFLLAARVSALSAAAVAQVVLFPVNDIYSALPLAIAMMEFNAFSQVSVSIVSLLLAKLMVSPNSYLYLWLAILLPFSFFSVLTANHNIMFFRIKKI